MKNANRSAVGNNKGDELSSQKNKRRYRNMKEKEESRLEIYALVLIRNDVTRVWVTSLLKTHTFHVESRLISSLIHFSQVSHLKPKRSCSTMTNNTTTPTIVNGDIPPPSLRLVKLWKSCNLVEN
jgi:hypothetical protein